MSWSSIHPIRRRLRVAILALVLLAAGCGDGTGDGADDPLGAPQPTSSTTTSMTEEDPMDDDGSPVPTGRSDAAVADLAERLGIDSGEVTVVSVEAVTWSDGSLGCPEPGMGYTQALLDGVRIVLELDGQRYHYHGGESGDPFLCTNPQEPSSIG